MPPALPEQAEDDEYHSSSDSDFDEAPPSDSDIESQSSHDEGPRAKGRPKKRKAAADGDLEMGSGDEGIIAQGRKKKRKKSKGKKKETQQEDAEDEDDDDENGGIRVRLRSGRGGEEKAKRVAANSSAATIDIVSVWARLNAPPSAKAPSPHPTSSPEKENKDPEKPSPVKPPAAPSAEETVMIPHTYTFAGQTHTSQKAVPISSPEAQAYIQNRQRSSNKSRPLARKNLLEPNPSRLINGVAPPVRTDLPPSIGGNMQKGKAVEKKSKDPKLNTVEKSKLDWQAEVERKGLREELEKAGKSGTDYLSRRDFLDRVETGRDERERVERLKGKT